MHTRKIRPSVIWFYVTRGKAEGVVNEAFNRIILGSEQIPKGWNKLKHTTVIYFGKKTRR